ncbi:dUTP diphosphatase [Bacillus mojavensis]
MQNKNLKEVKKSKRYYKVGEMVWVVDEKKEGKVKAIDKDNRKVTVTIKEGQKIDELVVDLWKIDKLKYKAKEKLEERSRKFSDSEKLKQVHKLLNSIMYPEVFFAKKREDAIIPSKRDEDGGYDIYASLDDKFKTEKGFFEIHCPKLATTLVPTGIASALPKTHYLNIKHERGSTGVQSMGVFAGLIDSGYRDEIFVAIAPLHKDVVITNEVHKVVVEEDVIKYPLSKAICQGTIDLVPMARITEIDLETLENMESVRGKTKLGQSGK